MTLWTVSACTTLLPAMAPVRLRRDDPSKRLTASGPIVDGGAFHATQGVLAAHADYPRSDAKCPVSGRAGTIASQRSLGVPVLGAPLEDHRSAKAGSMLRSAAWGHCDPLFNTMRQALRIMNLLSPCVHIVRNARRRRRDRADGSGCRTRGKPTTLFTTLARHVAFNSQ